MPGSRRRVADRADPPPLGGAVLLLQGGALRRFSQTCRDLIGDPGTFFNPKRIILGEPSLLAAIA